MLNRDDVIRIVEGVIRNLEIEVHGGYFTSSNSRTILLKYEGKTISSTDIDITSKPEYDG